MKKIMKGLSLWAISNSSLYKTRFQLKNPKDETESLEKSGIYRIRCQNGSPFSYVGQTKRRIGQRFDEHVGNFRRNEEGKSAMADHWLEEMHLGRKKDIELLKEVRNDGDLNMWESIFIRRLATEELVNADCGPVTVCPLFGLLEHRSNSSIECGEHRISSRNRQKCQYQQQPSVENCQS